MPDPKPAAENADKPAESGRSTSVSPPPPAKKPAADVEIGGPKGPDPTRYGDWEQKGRCTDF